MLKSLNSGPGKKRSDYPEIMTTITIMSGLVRISKMTFLRRDFLLLALGGLIGSGVAHGKAARTARGVAMQAPVSFPPFELQGSTDTVDLLRSGIAGWRVERWGVNAHSVWLQWKDGSIAFVSVAQRDLAPMFEVFTLGVLDMAELEDRWRRWEPPAVPTDLPEGLRQSMMTKPSPPAAPTDFEPWPLAHWRTEVVRRAEFVVENADVGRTFGDNPNAQSAARPGRVPPEANASCEVAAGLLFTGEEGRL